VLCTHCLNFALSFLVDGKVVGDVLSLGYFEKDFNASAFDAEKFKFDMSVGCLAHFY